jgi:hypothetical protein
MSKIYTEQYSEKSFVVIGDTQEHKESLKAMGGKWNSRLTNKEGDIFGAWLFWSAKKLEVDNWIKNGYPSVNKSERNYDNSFGNTNSSDRQISIKIESMERKIDYLIKLVEALSISEENHSTRQKQSSSTVSRQVVIDSDDEDVPSGPPKRLLARKQTTK